MVIRMKQGFIANPYMPENEFVPDGEPHLFEGRIYVYGSHESAGGQAFCIEDYVCYSAPEWDLTDWKYEGVIYRKEQDPLNRDGSHQMYAPDVTKGVDGRYYLYYGLDMTGKVSVAVCDSPAGSYEFYGHLQNSDGSIYEENLPYDPAVICEDAEHIYLYYGFSIFFDLPTMKQRSPGCSVVCLDKDMKTVISKPQVILPALWNEKGTGFEGHAYFEAPSIRKIENRYYLVYCSANSHELCYAVSEYPDRDFVFGGTIISNADIGYQGNHIPVAYYGNIHGGMVCAKGSWYIFYHRHTHGTQFSRQACAEKITIEEDGKIRQVCVTSQGLNGTPLPGMETYGFGIVCNLAGPQGACVSECFSAPLPSDTPKLILDKESQKLYLHHFTPGSVCAVKYLDFTKAKPQEVIITAKGGNSVIVVSDEEGELARCQLTGGEEKQRYCGQLLRQPKGETAIFFTHEKGEEKEATAVDLYEFCFQ